MGGYRRKGTDALFVAIRALLIPIYICHRNTQDCTFLKHNPVLNYDLLRRIYVSYKMPIKKGWRDTDVTPSFMRQGCRYKATRKFIYNLMHFVRNIMISKESNSRLGCPLIKYMIPNHRPLMTIYRPKVQPWTNNISVQHFRSCSYAGCIGTSGKSYIKIRWISCPNW